MNDELREAVALELEDLARLHLIPDGPLSSLVFHGDSPARLRIRRRLVEEYLERQSSPVRAGRIQVVTAGPPGAGKSTATGTGFEDYRVLDADIVKTQLLELERDAGRYDSLLEMRLSDGGPIMLNEVATLVHRESALIIDQVRQVCMRAGENLVVQTTLSWPPMVEELVHDLAAYNYRELDVISIAVSRDVALERARERWWVARCDADNPDGGRFVPAAAIDTCFDADGSICHRNAVDLRLLAGSRLGIQTTLRDAMHPPDVRRLRPSAASE